MTYQICKLEPGDGPDHLCLIKQYRSRHFLRGVAFDQKTLRQYVPVWTIPDAAGKDASYFITGNPKTKRYAAYRGTIFSDQVFFIEQYTKPFIFDFSDGIHSALDALQDNPLLTRLNRKSIAYLDSVKRLRGIEEWARIAPEVERLVGEINARCSLYYNGYKARRNQPYNGDYVVAYEQGLLELAEILNEGRDELEYEIMRMLGFSYKCIDEDTYMILPNKDVLLPGTAGKPSMIFLYPSRVIDYLTCYRMRDDKLMRSAAGLTFFYLLDKMRPEWFMTTAKSIKFEQRKRADRAAKESSGSPVKV